MTTKVVPTVGRVVWFYPPGAYEGGQQPRAAMVAYVHSERSVNLGYLDPSGEHDNATSVPLWQGVEIDGPAPSGAFCMWMPYQKGQAAKAEEAEKCERALAGNPIF